MLKLRILTACIAVPLVWLAIFELPSFTFSIIAMLFMLFAAYEWSVLVGDITWRFRILFNLAIVITIIASAYSMWVACVLLSLALIVWVWLSVAVIVFQKKSSPFGLESYVLRAIMGWVVLSAGWLSLTVMRVHPGVGPRWLLYACMLAWVVDTGAYFAGHAFGSRFLASRVSPKKTWEGFWGGMLAAVILIIIANFFLPHLSGHRVLFVVVSLLAAIVSVFGDLSISVMKRLVQVKDTGSFFPGHGGVLDRIDSLLPVLLLFASAAVFLNL